jgi:ammonium transporter, Amt family
VHLGGGVIGSLCVGLLATRSVNPAGADGLLYGGGYRLIGLQAMTVFTVSAYSLVVTVVIAVMLNRLVGNRVGGRAEAVGLDLSQHGEAAYELTPAGRLDAGSVARPAPTEVPAGAAHPNGHGGDDRW